LNSLDPAAAGVNFTPAEPPATRSQQTLLFPTLVNRIKPDRRLSVLEIGPALPETIEFFSQFKCRLHFAAMYTDPVLQLQLGDYTEAELAEHISRSFGF
jgi:hypothetical protein